MVPLRVPLLSGTKDLDIKFRAKGLESRDGSKDFGVPACHQSHLKFSGSRRLQKMGNLYFRDQTGLIQIIAEARNRGLRLA